MKKYVFCPQHIITTLHIPNALYNEIVDEWDSVLLSCKLLEYKISATWKGDSIPVISLWKNVNILFDLVMRREKSKYAEYRFDLMGISIYSGFYLSFSGELILEEKLSNTDDFIKMLRKLKVML